MKNITLPLKRQKSTGFITGFSRPVKAPERHVSVALAQCSWTPGRATEEVGGSISEEEVLAARLL